MTEVSLRPRLIGSDELVQSHPIGYTVGSITGFISSQGEASAVAVGEIS
jgi:hypothetical protein